MLSPNNHNSTSSTQVHGILNQLPDEDTGVGGVSSRSLQATPTSQQI
jgi:hypothetical protein